MEVELDVSEPRKTRDWEAEYPAPSILRGIFNYRDYVRDYNVSVKARDLVDLERKIEIKDAYVKDAMAQIKDLTKRKDAAFATFVRDLARIKPKTRKEMLEQFEAGTLFDTDSMYAKEDIEHKLTEISQLSARVTQYMREIRIAKTARAHTIDLIERCKDGADFLVTLARITEPDARADAVDERNLFLSETIVANLETDGHEERKANSQFIFGPAPSAERHKAESEFARAVADALYAPEKAKERRMEVTLS